MLTCGGNIPKAFLFESYQKVFSFEFLCCYQGCLLFSFHSVAPLTKPIISSYCNMSCYKFSEPKKSNKLSTIHRTLKKIMPGRRQAKQTPFPENGEPSAASKEMKRSKTDTKLVTKETDTQFRSGSGEQIRSDKPLLLLFLAHIR